MKRRRPVRDPVTGRFRKRGAPPKKTPVLRDQGGRFRKRGGPVRVAPAPRGAGGRFRPRYRTLVFGDRDPLRGIRGRKRRDLAAGENGVLTLNEFLELAGTLEFTDKEAYTLWYSP